MEERRIPHVFLFLLFISIFVAAEGSQWGWLSSPSANPQRVVENYVYKVEGEVSRPGVYLFSTPQTPLEILNKANGLKVKGTFITWGEVQMDEHLFNGATLTVEGNPLQATLSHMTLEQHRIFSLKLSINRATREDLSAITGIGPYLAEEICRMRQQKGIFHSLEELLEVPGIGRKRLEALSTYLTL